MGQLMFKARPCWVIQRRQPTPIAATLRLSSQIPVKPGWRALKVQPVEHIDQHPLQLAHVPVQIRTAPLKIQHGVGHQLTGQVMGHLPAPIDAMHGCWRLVDREVQVVAAGPAAKGVTRLMLQQP